MQRSTQPTRTDRILLAIWAAILLLSYSLLAHRFRLDLLGAIGLALQLAALIIFLPLVTRFLARERARARELSTILPTTILEAENILSFEDSSCFRATYRRHQVRRINADNVQGFSFRGATPRKSPNGEVLHDTSATIVDKSENLNVFEHAHPEGGVIIDAVFKHTPKRGEVVDVWVLTDFTGYFPDISEFLGVRVVIPTETQIIRVVSPACRIVGAWGEIREPDGKPQPLPSPPTFGSGDPPVLLQPADGSISGLRAATSPFYEEIEWRIHKPVVGNLYVLRWTWAAEQRQVIARAPEVGITKQSPATHS